MRTNIIASRYIAFSLLTTPWTRRFYHSDSYIWIIWYQSLPYDVVAVNKYCKRLRFRGLNIVSKRSKKKNKSASCCVMKLFKMFGQLFDRYQKPKTTRKTLKNSNECEQLRKVVVKSVWISTGTRTKRIYNLLGNKFKQWGKSCERDNDRKHRVSRHIICC